MPEGLDQALEQEIERLVQLRDQRNSLTAAIPAAAPAPILSELERIARYFEEHIVNGLSGDKLRDTPWGVAYADGVTKKGLEGMLSFTGDGKSGVWLKRPNRAPVACSIRAYHPLAPAKALVTPVKRTASVVVDVDKPSKRTRELSPRSSPITSADDRQATKLRGSDGRVRSAARAPLPIDSEYTPGNVPRHMCSRCAIELADFPYVSLVLCQRAIC